MTATRQDAWTNDEDLLLAEVVLRHIREGGTQLGAFEEVGKRLSRTAAACGFRWNSFVRKQYKSGIELAKKQRKEGKKAPVQAVSETPSQPEALKPGAERPIQTLQDVIAYLQEYEKSQSSQSSLTSENLALKERTEQLVLEIEKLHEDKRKLENSLKIVENDYKALIEIMERARKMVVLHEDERSKKVEFQVDSKGSLEKIEK